MFWWIQYFFVQQYYKMIQLALRVPKSYTSDFGWAWWKGLPAVDHEKGSGRRRRSTSTTRKVQPAFSFGRRRRSTLVDRQHFKNTFFLFDWSWPFLGWCRPSCSFLPGQQLTSVYAHWRPFYSPFLHAPLVHYLHNIFTRCWSTNIIDF